jgi:plastocyanin
MKKLLLVAFAVVAVAAAAPLSAATVTVQITRAGFSPASVTVKTGDAVTFHNADTIAHQISFTKTAGVTCSPASLVLQPGQSVSCTFATAGAYDYRDPTQKGNFKGTVVVQAAPAGVTLAASPLLVTYGGRTTLSGSVSTGAGNEKVSVLAQPCGSASASTLTSVTTAAGGAWSVATQPLRITTYTARWKSATSTAVTVKVRPRLTLGKVAAHRYSVRVYAGDSMAGKVVFFQRYAAALRRWVTVKRVVLGVGPSAVAPTVVSAKTFTASVRARTKVRALITQAQVGGCYAPNRSNVIYS